MISREFSNIDDAIKDVKKGKFLIVVDDEDRENEGDFFLPAEFSSPENINYLVSKARGLVCMPITKKIASKFNLDLMAKNNNSVHETAFTVSVDGLNSGTGISTKDRDKTIRIFLEDKSSESDILTPGHIFPLIANEGGVVARNGHTEAAIDLCKLAGLKEVGIICEILNEDGSMARVPDLIKISKEENIKIISIKDLQNYILEKENKYICKSEIPFSTKYGDFQLKFYKNKTDHHIALVYGDIKNADSVLTRVHSECFTGDIFGSLRCDCGDQLDASLKMITEHGTGVLLYLKQEGRGIGLENKIKAYSLQDNGFDTVDANHQLGFSDDLRKYDVCKDIFKDLDVTKIDLITNNPKKIQDLEFLGIEINKRVPIEINPNKINENYLITKRDRMGHMILNNIH